MSIERDLDQMPWPAQTASEKLVATKFPHASKSEIDRRLRDWLARKDED